MSGGWPPHFGQRGGLANPLTGLEVAESSLSRFGVAKPPPCHGGGSATPMAKPSKKNKLEGLALGVARGQKPSQFYFF
jgi:hypothetical protein